MTTMTINANDFRACCGAFGTGVVLITTKDDEATHGMTANALMSISLDPPLIAISVDQRAKMLPLIEKSGRFAVSILNADQGDLAWHFAGKQKEGLVPDFDTVDGVPVLKDCLAYMVADVARASVEGDHTLFIGAVTAAENCSDVAPLIFHSSQMTSLK